MAALNIVSQHLPSDSRPRGADVEDGAINARTSLQLLHSMMKEIDSFIRDHSNVHKRIKDGFPEMLSLINEIDIQLEDVVCSGCKCNAQTDIAAEGTQTARPSLEEEQASLSAPANTSAAGPASAGEKNATIDKFVPSLTAEPRRSKVQSEWKIARGRRNKRGTRVKTKVEEVDHKRSDVVATTPKKKRLRKSRFKNDAIIVHLGKPEGGGGKSYADTLKLLRTEVKPDQLGCKIASIRKSQKGDVIVELEKGSENSAALVEAMAGALGQGAQVRGLVPAETLTILDIEEGIDGSDVVAALCVANSELRSEDVQVRFLKAGKWGTQLAIIRMPAKTAAMFLETGRVRVGWTNCRVRRKTSVLKCFRCHGVGHMAAGCTNPDRSDKCRKCGHTGHKAASCTEKPCCMTCKDRSLVAAHHSGTIECPAYLEANKKITNDR